MFRKLRNLMVLVGLARTGKRAWDRRNATRQGTSAGPTQGSRRFI